VVVNDSTSVLVAVSVTLLVAVTVGPELILVIVGPELILMIDFSTVSVRTTLRKTVVISVVMTVIVSVTVLSLRGCSAALVMTGIGVVVGGNCLLVSLDPAAAGGLAAMMQLPARKMRKDMHFILVKFELDMFSCVLGKFELLLLKSIRDCYDYCCIKGDSLYIGRNDYCSIKRLFLFYKATCECYLFLAFFVRSFEMSFF
jgi:hypothetical protein